VFFLYGFGQRQKLTNQSKFLQVWYEAEQRIKRPTYIDRDHGFCGPCPDNKQLSNAWQLNDLVNHISPIMSFLINIGAGSVAGGQYDPTYPLLTTSNSSFGALLIDPNKNPSFFNAYPHQTNIHIIHDYI
jgi:hypothetical protein